MAGKPKKADESKPKAEKIDAVAAELSAIRDQGKHDRKGCFIKFFHALDESLNITVSIAKTDALLIKATRERFDVSPDADIVLMALGLLQGYKYQEMSLLNRRKKYLRESNYLQTHSRSENKIFNNASEKEKERLLDNLRKTGEDGLIWSLAEFLLKQNIAEYIEDLDGYITKSKNPKAILPKPSYTLSDVSDEANYTSPGTRTEVRHVENINCNHNENTVKIKVINIIGGDDPPITTDPSGGGGNSNRVLLEEEQRKSHGHNWWHIGILLVCSCLCIVALSSAMWSNRLPTSTNRDIQVSAEKITLQPGEVYQIKPMLLSEDSEDVAFEYTSSNPDILKVLHDGLLYAQNGMPEGESASVEIIIRGPHGTTKKVSFTIENSAGNDYREIDTDNYEITYSIENQVRLFGGDKTWGNSVDAKIGDKVEFRVAYKNNSNVDQMNVMIKDILPSGLRLIPGSTKIVNTTYPNGGIIEQDDITSKGINIGGYTSGSNAFVRFQAEVVDDNLVCGKTALVNWAQGGVDKATIQDYAKVIVTKDCGGTYTPPSTLPNTGPEAVAGGVIAAGSIVTAAGYYIASRRSLR